MPGRHRRVDRQGTAGSTAAAVPREESQPGFRDHVQRGPEEEHLYDVGLGHGQLLPQGDEGEEGGGEEDGVRVAERADLARRDPGREDGAVPLEVEA